MTLFEHINYGGASLDVTTDTPDLRTRGAQWNDQASSVRVPAGATVTLYQDINYGGQQLTLVADAPDLRVYPGPGADGTWNDAASSVKIAGGASATSERLKKGSQYVECNAGGTITLSTAKTDASKVVITKHDDQHFDATFTQANKVLSIQQDGSLQSRPAGTYGGYENLAAITTPKPDVVNLLYRVDGGVVLGGTVLQIVEE